MTHETDCSQTTIDLYLTTIDPFDRVVRSEINRDLDHDSGHLLINIELDLEVQ